jgi:hypothetical protein
MREGGGNERTDVDERDPLLVLHAEHHVADPHRVELRDGRRAGASLAQLERQPVVVVVALELPTRERPERPADPMRPVVGQDTGAVEVQRGTALGLDHAEVGDRRPADVVDAKRVPHDLAGLTLEDALPYGEAGVEAKQVRDRVAQHVRGHQGGRRRRPRSPRAAGSAAAAGPAAWWARHRRVGPASAAGSRRWRAARCRSPRTTASAPAPARSSCAPAARSRRWRPWHGQQAEAGLRGRAPAVVAVENAPADRVGPVSMRSGQVAWATFPGYA